MNEYLKITMDKGGLNFVELFLSDAPSLDSYDDRDTYLADLQEYAGSKGIDEQIIRNDSLNRAYALTMILEDQTDDLFFVIPLLEGSDALEDIVKLDSSYVASEKINAEDAETLFLN